VKDTSIDKVGMWLLWFIVIALRATGYIDWPWWVVLGPLWAPWVLMAFLWLFFFLLDKLGIL
jgi:hypothetical protein